MTSGLPDTSPSVVVHGPESFTIEHRKVDPPGPGEVLVEVAAAGICGSDLELFDGTRPAPYVRYPVVPGHEWSGTIAAVGPYVEGLSVGDRVVAQGFRHCERCARCREGATNLCSAPYAETGFTHAGAFSGHVTVPARLVHVLAPDADLEAAALIEPSACVVEGLLAAAPRIGARVAVVGTGTLSLVACQLLSRGSPRELTVIGDSPSGRELARQWGATGFVSRAEASADGWTLDADYVFEAVGRPESAATAIAAARRGGTVVLEGIPGSPAPGDLTAIVLRHLAVYGIFGASAAAWEQTVALFTTGHLELTPLISHRYATVDVESALHTLRSRQPDVRKVLLEPEVGPVD